MIATSTVKTIVTILLAIDIIWLIYILIRGYTESLVRTIVFAIILGIILGYLQNTKLEMLSFRAIKNDLFPPNIPQYSYTVNEEDTLYSHRITYTFLEPIPELKLDMDPNGRTFTIRDPEPVNLVLDQLNLPRVKSGAQELYTITGNQTDIGIYRWDDYERGTLILERGLYQNKNTMQSYHGIVRIIIDSRKY
ncbi:MAG: hypothetical protein H5U06_07015 [Candidatus Aminicenantes bacterium]|nr:hypothetical protein [Candidatus Aminicenantes bacterium]